jgi:uncharacterized protein (DUF1778 family)
MPNHTTTARLEARISTDLHAMLKRAAELQGRSMTDFVARAEIAAYALLVDAKDEQAAAFYRHHGFIALPGTPLTPFLPLETASTC